MSKINSCKDCNKRTVGCHATCEAYKKERDELDKRNKERGKYTSLRSNLVDREIMAYQHFRRDRGLK